MIEFSSLFHFFTFCNLISLSTRKLILPSCLLLPTTILKIIDTHSTNSTNSRSNLTWSVVFSQSSRKPADPSRLLIGRNSFAFNDWISAATQLTTPFFLSTNREEILIYQPLLWGVSSTGAELFSDISRHNAANDFFPLVFKTINPTLIWKLNRILRSFGIGTGGGSKSPPLNVVVSHMKHCWLWLVVVSHHQMIFGGFKDTDCCL